MSRSNTCASRSDVANQRLCNSPAAEGEEMWPQGYLAGPRRRGGALRGPACGPMPVTWATPPAFTRDSMPTGIR